MQAQDQGGAGVPLGPVFNMLSLKVFRLLSQEERSSRHGLGLSRKDCAGGLLGSHYLDPGEWMRSPRSPYTVRRGPPRVEHWKDCMPLLMVFIILYCHFLLSNRVGLQVPWGQWLHLACSPLYVQRVKSSYRTVQFSSSVVSNSLRPSGLQHARPSCPSPTPIVYSNSCPLSQWCHPTVSSSVVPFSSHLQSFPASGSFLTSRFFASGGQNIRVSASISVLPMNIQYWFPLGLTGWISLQSKGLSRVFSNHSSKASILWCSAFFIVQLSHPYMTTGKTIALTRWTHVGKVMSLLSNMLSRLVITFLPRSKHLLISWLQVTICSDFGALKYKVCHCFHCFPIYLPWSDGTKCHDLSFLNVEF